MRRGLLAAGVLAFLAGVAALLVRGTVGGWVRLAVPFVGALAALQAYRTVRASPLGAVEATETPDPELVAPSPAPGEDLEDALEEFVGEEPIFRRTRVRRGLAGLAAAALSRFEGLPAAEARDRIERGTWTDDDRAAAFLGEVEPPSSWRDRVGALLGVGSRHDRGVRHAVAAIAAVVGRPVGEGPAEVERVEPRAGGAFDGEARATDRWRGVSAVTLACVGAGVLVREPAIVLAGVVGLGFGAYARAGSPPSVDLAVERSLADDDPEPGDAVEVTVSVRNEGDRALPDLRLVDGVPEALAVEGGTPRLGTPLAAGGEATIEYAVGARRGVHEFGPLRVLARDLPGGSERALAVEAGTTLTCVPRLYPAQVSLRDRTGGRVGRIATDRGGEGVEFRAIREYREGDPLARIDWNRLARTGEFATLAFREERAATAVIAIDARAEAYVAPAPDPPHAVDRGVEAARRVFAGLLEAGNEVGLVALAPGDCWLAPGVGDRHRARGRERLAVDPALSPLSDGGPFGRTAWERRLRARLPADAQLLVVSPLVDGYPADLARRFEAYGHPTTVISPDPTAGRTPGQRAAAVARAVRIADLRGAGVPVVDWGWGESIDVALARFGGRS